MANKLLAIIPFSGLTVGVPDTAPHGLNNHGELLIPDFLAGSFGGFTITADATDVTITRSADGPADVDVLAWALHTVPRVLGGIADMTPQPFVFGAGGVYTPPTDTRSACQIAKNATQSIPAGVSTLITYEVVETQSGTGITPVVATERLTIVTAGVYYITATTQWEPGAAEAADHSTTIFINGATTNQMQSAHITSTVNTGESVSVMALLAPGNFITAQAFTNEVGGLDILTAHLNAFYIAPASV